MTNLIIFMDVLVKDICLLVFFLPLSLQYHYLESYHGLFLCLVSIIAVFNRVDWLGLRDTGFYVLGAQHIFDC